MESFMGTAPAPWLNVGVHLEAEFTELQMVCPVATPLLQHHTDALANTFCSAIALGVMSTAECVLDSQLLHLLGECVFEARTPVRADAVCKSI